MPSSVAPVIQNTVNGVPPVYQPAYVPGFAPYNVMGGAGGGYAQQSELSVQVEKLHVPAPLPSQASSGADSGLVSDIASLSLGDSNSSNSKEENSPQSQAKDSGRSEHVPDIVTSADVKQLNNIGEPLPGDQPAPPDVGGHDHNVGNSHTSNTGVNQPVQGMPNIDHHAFVSQHSVPVYNQGAVHQYSQQVINGGYYYVPVVPFTGAAAGVPAQHPQY